MSLKPKKKKQVESKSLILECLEKQEEELNAIEAIYGIFGDFNRIDDDNFSSCFTCVIRPTTSLEAIDNRVTTTLTIRIPKDYPDNALPKIEVTSFQGLKMNEVKDLLNLLKEESMKKKGTQHLFDILTMCQEYLIPRNAPKTSIIVGKNLKSLHEQMQDDKEKVLKNVEVKSKLAQEEANIKSEVENKLKEEESKLSRFDMKYESDLRDKWMEEQKLANNLKNSPEKVTTAPVVENFELKMHVATPSLSNFTSASQDGSKQSKSRYRSDFLEIKVLGAGAFGHVTLCQNKIDGRLYALKRISLSHRTHYLTKILRVC